MRCSHGPQCHSDAVQYILYGQSRMEYTIRRLHDCTTALGQAGLPFERGDALVFVSHKVSAFSTARARRGADKADPFRPGPASPSRPASRTASCR
jgi:hypothetical protein